MRPASCISRPSPSRVRHGYVPPSHKVKEKTSHTNTHTQPQDAGVLPAGLTNVVWEK